MNLSVKNAAGDEELTCHAVDLTFKFCIEFRVLNFPNNAQDSTIIQAVWIQKHDYIDSICRDLDYVGHCEGFFIIAIQEPHDLSGHVSCKLSRICLHGCKELSRSR